MSAAWTSASPMPLTKSPVGFESLSRIFGQQRQIGPRRQDPPGRQIEGVVVAQVQRLGRDLAGRAWRAAAAGRRPVLGSSLKHIRRWPEEIERAAVVLPIRGLREGGSRPRRYSRNDAAGEAARPEGVPRGCLRKRSGRTPHLTCDRSASRLVAAPAASTTSRRSARYSSRMAGFPRRIPNSS